MKVRRRQVFSLLFFFPKLITFPDNAIPIEGWINDPTDNDLLHILPMLEALQYVTDVRAFLGLRRGEAEGAQ